MKMTREDVEAILSRYISDVERAAIDYDKDESTYNMIPYDQAKYRLITKICAMLEVSDVAE